MQSGSDAGPATRGERCRQGYYFFTGTPAVASSLALQEQKNEKVIPAFVSHYD
jgi:hypothetical protein